MSNITGSILEFKGKKAVVMTSKCDFITIKKLPDMFIGQQVYLNRSAISKTNNRLKYLSIAAMLVLVLCSVVFLQILRPASVFAYVDVDINPSLELSIDKNAKVVDVKTLNSDAQTLIKDLQLVNNPLENAVRIIIQESQNKGFIRYDKENAVLISASIKPGKHSSANASHEKALDDIVKNLSKADFSLDSVSIKQKIIKVTPEKRAAALKNNISMGRYDLYEKISGISKDMNIEKAKTEGLSDMLKAVVANKIENSNSAENNDSVTKSAENTGKDQNKPGENTVGEEKTDTDTNTSTNKKLPENSNSIKSGSKGTSNSQHSDNAKNSPGRSDSKEDKAASSNVIQDKSSTKKTESDKDLNTSSDKKETFDQSSSSVTPNVDKTPPGNDKTESHQEKDNKDNHQGGSNGQNNSNGSGKK